MTLEIEGVTAEPVEAQEAPAAVETIEEVEAVEVEPELTVEEKYEKLERDVAGKQKKIDRQTAANRKTLENYEKQRKENERLSALIEQQTPNQEPSIDDFETHDEFVNALVDYRADLAVAGKQKEYLAKQEQLQQQTIMNERQALRQTQEVEYMVENPMYKASVNEVDSYIKTLDSSPHTQEAVIAQLYDGNVPQVIDYFGSNNGEHLEELGDIARMTPPQAAVAVYKIQQKLSLNPTKRETKTPTKPVNVKKATGTGSKPLDKRSGRDVMDWVNS